MLKIPKTYIGIKITKSWPRRDLNTQPSDLESDALPLRHGVVARTLIPPR